MTPKSSAAISRSIWRSKVRQAIAEAAVHCEYGRLAALAREGGDQFTFTFGAADSAQYWRREEEAGREAMKFLAGMLDRPYGQVSGWGPHPVRLALGRDLPELGGGP